MALKGATRLKAAMIPPWIAAASQPPSQPLHAEAMWSGDTWQVLVKHYANLNGAEVIRLATEQMTDESQLNPSPSSNAANSQAERHAHTLNGPAHP